MKVLKFGGTSVGSAQRIKSVAELVCNRGKNIVVLSAMSGTTNSLLQISDALRKNDITAAGHITDELEEKYQSVIDELFSDSDRLSDVRGIIKGFFDTIRDVCRQPLSQYTEKIIVSQGELISTTLMANHIADRGVSVALIPALEFMRTDANGEPDIDSIEKSLLPLISRNADAQIYITQGFICRDHEGNVHNLQRGGSDYSASLIGAAVNAEEIEIWTDIDGMHNNDPRFVKNTSPVHNLHFEEAAELAYFGAKILHPTCILPAKMKNIPVRLLNTMQPEAEGTRIDNTLRQKSIKAVAAKDGIIAIKIKSSRMLLAYGFLKRVFEIFEKYQTPIDMITTSEVGVSVTIDNESNLTPIVRELEKLGDVTVDRDMVIICVVGDLDWRNKGFEARALDAIAEVPVRMISYGGSNYNISFLIEAQHKQRVLQLLSQNLFN